MRCYQSNNLKVFIDVEQIANTKNGFRVSTDHLILPVTDTRWFDQKCTETFASKPLEKWNANIRAPATMFVQRRNLSRARFVWYWRYL